MSGSASNGPCAVAPPRVFAIPELVEIILLSLPWSDLFVLQRVSKTFHHVICNSRPLRSLMMFHSLKPHRASHASSLLREYSWSEFEPYQYDAVTKTDTDLTIRLTYDVWYPRDESSRALHDGMGIAKRQRQFMHVVQINGSWRLLRLCTLDGEVRIQVDVIVHLPRDDSPFGFSFRGYQDVIAMPAGTVTFGDLTDVLAELAYRPLEDHRILLTAAGRRAGPDSVTNAEHIRFRSCQRVAAVVSWVPGQLDRSIAMRRETERLLLRRETARMERERDAEA